MSNIWLSSDQHFNNYNILKYESESRPFGSVEEMNQALIKNWNDVVEPEDKVYVLGDFVMGTADRTQGILDQLKGDITLIRGNHDTPTKLEIYKENNIPIKDIEYLTYKGKLFILCHFPITNEEFIKMIRGNNSEVIILYGHVHSNAPRGYYNGTYHIGVDTNDLTPVNIEQIWQECQNGDKGEIG